jgi:hypothetical protein
MNLTLRRWLAAPIIVGAVGIVGTADVAATGSNLRAPVRVVVVDEVGAPRPDATVMACPYRDGTADCGDLIAASTDRRGVGRLRLDPLTRYEFTAFVRDPAPPWACPGFEIDGSQYYFAVDPFSALPREVRHGATLAIVEPDASDCAPPPVTTAQARVVDGAGNPLPTATTGLFICPLAPDGTPCPGPTFDGPDPDGIIRFDVDPTVTYRLNAFYVNSGWPCPDYTGPNGDTFHFSDITDHLGADLLTTTTTFVIEPGTCLVG